MPDVTIAKVAVSGIPFRLDRPYDYAIPAELAEQVGVGTAFVSRVERGQKRMRLETMLAFADALHISAGLLFYEENRDAQLQTLVKMLEGQPPEFLDGVIALVRVCVENFENRKTDPAQV